MNFSYSEINMLMLVLKLKIEHDAESIETFEKSDYNYSPILKNMREDLKEMQQLYEKLLDYSCSI